MAAALVSRRGFLAGAAGVTSVVALGASAPSAAAAGRVVLGAYTNGMDGSPKRLSYLATNLRQSLSIASVFRGPGDIWPGPVEAALAVNRTLLVAWYLDHHTYGYWASSAAKPELVAVARRVKAYGRPVAIRPWAEMNGDWQSFQPKAAPTDGYSSGYSAFVAAWRNVVNVFRAEGVKNVKWVFNPTTDTYAETTDVRRIWPGQTYVDVLGLDGYNWGTGGIFAWRSFSNIYQTQYNRLVALAPSRPVWICEVGCADPLSTQNSVTAPYGQSKAIWWRDASLAIGRMPSVRAVVLFDVSKERDWRAASSSSALTGLRGALTTMRGY
ncbi:MAG: glycosyl hydrolase [Dermatophilaceae bacterium]